MGSWWPTPDGKGSAFYAYMYPEPAGYASTNLEPASGTYDHALGEFVLPYAEVVGSDDPDGKVLAFLEATYASGATLAGWDRLGLEVNAGSVGARPWDRLEHSDG